MRKSFARRTASQSMPRVYLNSVFMVVLFFTLGFAILLFWKYPIPEQWDRIPFGAFATVITSCVAGLGALAVAETYRDKKSAEIRQRQWEFERALQNQRQAT